MLSALASLFARHTATQAANINAQIAREHEQLAQEHSEARASQMRIIGWRFKCGPWRWHIVAKRTDAYDRPLTPEITAVPLLNVRKGGLL